MRILIIARGYPSDQYKLNGIFEFDQAKALAACGHEVILAALDLRSIRRWRRWGTFGFTQDGVHIEALNLPVGNVPKYILHSIRKKALKAVYSRVITTYGKPDIIHSHFIEQGYATVKALSDCGIPLVHTEHFSGMNQVELPDYYIKLGNYTYKKMARVLVVSSPLKNNLMEKFEVEATVVPNIVDLSAFNFEIKPKDTSKFNFISVGSLTKRKRMDLLINSFSQAFKEDPSVNLFIFGEGPERKCLEQLIHQFELDTRVHLMGQQSRENIANTMQACHCFVLASRLETFGVVLIETMAMGLPVISTRCGGPEDLVTPENGLLVERENVDQLTQSLMTMKNNFAAYAPAQIALAAKTVYSPQAIAATLTQIYQSILQ